MKIIPCASKDRIVAGTGIERIVTGIAHQGIIAAATDYFVVTRSTAEDVVAAASINRFIAAGSTEVNHNPGDQLWFRINHNRWRWRRTVLRWWWCITRAAKTARPAAKNHYFPSHQVQKRYCRRQ